MRHFLWLLVALFLSCSQGEAPSGGTGQPKIGNRVGNLAPDFTLTSRDGSQVKLSDYRGKIVFLNFWATWCGPCRMEMPAMEKLHHEMKNKDFVILAVSEDEGGWRAVDPFVKEIQLSFKILLDENQKVALKYNSYRFPETFIIDKDGRIHDKRVGPAPWDQPKYLKYFTQLVENLPKETRGLTN